MLESRNRLSASALVLMLAVAALSGCEASKDGAPAPPPTTNEVMKAFFNPATGALPHPTDLFFSGSTDGTLNLPSIAFRPPSIQNSLNALDGWSTTAPLTTSFSMPLLNTTLTATSVRLVEMYFSNTTKAPAQGAELPAGVTSPVRRVLTLGTDYSATVSPDVDSGGKVLLITPLKPLTPSTGATNIGYLVILTNGIMEPNGKVAQPDDFYAAIKAAPADCSNFTDATQNAVCRLTKAHLAVAGAVGTPAANVVLTWSFTTQSVDDTLGAVAATSTAQPTTVVPTGLTTKQANAALQGKANIFVGRTFVPYYLTPAANPTDRASVLTKFWTAAGASPVPGLDPTSRNLTRFNPLPAKVVDQLAIPVIVTVPNATAAGGVCAKPYAVAIVQHGITGNRSQALAMADSYADACTVVAAIDLPLHGLVDTTSLLYCSATNPGCLGARERTFDVDLVNNSNTSVAVSDGRIDSSGTHFINLSSPLTSRDNLRQAESDLLTFTKSVATLDVTGDGVSDVDPARISFTGLSLGSIAGTAALKFSGGLRTGTLSVPGGVLTRLLLDSQAFGPSIKAGVSAQGLVQDSYIYNLFFRDFQAIADAGDPINHIAGANARLPLHVQKVVGDAVIPNSATDRLIVAGGLRKISTVGPTAVGPGTGGYTTITAGSHGSLFDPTSSLPATVEMQRQAVTFAATAVQPGGPFVVITNPAVIEP